MKELLERLGFYDFLKKYEENWKIVPIIKRHYETSNTMDQLLVDEITGRTQPITITVNPYQKHVGTIIVPVLYSRNKTLYISKDDNDKFILGNCKNIETYGLKSYKDEEIFQHMSLVKIKDYKLSSSFYGHSIMKRTMFESNNLFNMTKIYPLRTCKDGTIRDVVELKSLNGKNLKFVLDDVEIIYPNVEKITKGYNFPIDRTIRKECKVKVYKKNAARLSYGTVAKVSNLVNAGNIKYAEIITRDNKKHLVERNKIKVIS